MSLADRFVREQSTGSVAEYNRRVYRLAATYLALLIIATAAIVLLFGHGEFFVTLSQRSNVETLTIAFVIVLFGYLGTISLPGAWGALRIIYYNYPAWVGMDRTSVETRKQASLKRKTGNPSTVYLNRGVQLTGRPTQPIDISLMDSAGSLGTIHIDGVRITHLDALQSSSNSVFAYFAQRINALAQARGSDAKLDIVQWPSIDDESAMQYASLVAFSQNLEKHLDSGPLWPVIDVTEQDVWQLIQEATELCPVLRNEAKLPDLEYQVEHRLPIIPEPLAFLALSRSEKRADPAASMGCALIVMVVILAFVVFFILVPPWLPPR